MSGLALNLEAQFKPNLYTSTAFVFEGSILNKYCGLHIMHYCMTPTSFPKMHEKEEQNILPHQEF